MFPDLKRFGLNANPKTINTPSGKKLLVYDDNTLLCAYFITLCFYELGVEIKTRRFLEAFRVELKNRNTATSILSEKVEPLPASYFEQLYKEIDRKIYHKKFNVRIFKEIKKPF